MPRFPRTENDIAALAVVVIEGLEQAAEDFPSPPVPAEALRAKLNAFNMPVTAAVAAETAAQHQHALKDEALEDLADSIKADLKYAEAAVRDRPEKLSRLGWGGRGGGRLGLGFPSRRAVYGVTHAFHHRRPIPRPPAGTRGPLSAPARAGPRPPRQPLTCSGTLRYAAHRR